MGIDNLPAQSSDPLLKDPSITFEVDKVNKVGYSQIVEADYSVVTGGFLATKTISLFTYNQNDQSAAYSFRPTFDAWIYMVSGGVTPYTSIYPYTSFEVRRCDFTEFSNYSTGAVLYAGTAELNQSFSVPNYTVRLVVNYFTSSATGFEYSKDSGIWVFYRINTGNIVQAFPPGTVSS